MKKKLLLLIFILLLTGCDATYEVEIYKDKVKEKFEYVSTNISEWEELDSNNESFRSTVLASSKYPYHVFIDAIVNEGNPCYGIECYKNKLISGPNELGQSLSYNKFKLDDYSKSFIINNCYKYFNIIEEEDRIVISSSLQNTCFDKYEKLDNIIIKLKTNHKVISHNATSVDGYHYTWNINRANKDNANISIILKKNEYIFNYENEFVKKILTIGGIAAIIIIVVGMFSLRTKRKHDKLNKI